MACKSLIALAISTLPLFANAAEGKGPFERATMATTGIPVLTTFGTLGTTSQPIEMLKSATSDALAFIGSDGEIRGAQFELAVRTYHASYPPPHMNDLQLAQAIAAAN